MDVDTLINSAMDENAMVVLVDRKAKNPWLQLGISDERWKHITSEAIKNIDAAEDLCRDTLHRSLTLAEKLVEVSRVQLNTNELSLLSAAIIINNAEKT
jgi:hypothetical protein